MEKIGHRGAKGHVAENTIASIDCAIKLGVDAVEVDVHICKTGELVVIHDSTINRTTTGKGKVNKLPYNKLKELRTEGYVIPTLNEVIEYCSNKCKIHIELKGKGTAIKVANLVEEAVASGNWAYNQLLVSSFKYSRLKKIKKQYPKIRLGIIAQKRHNKALKHALKNGYESVYLYHKRISPYLVRIAKLKKLEIYAWTVNESSAIRKMNKLGVRGVISDFPDKL